MVPSTADVTWTEKEGNNLEQVLAVSRKQDMEDCEALPRKNNDLPQGWDKDF